MCTASMAARCSHSPSKRSITFASLMTITRMGQQFRQENVVLGSSVPQKDGDEDDEDDEEEEGAKEGEAPNTDGNQDGAQGLNQ